MQHVGCITGPPTCSTVFIFLQVNNGTKQRATRNCVSPPAVATPKTAGTADAVDRNLDLAMSPTQFVASFTLA
jgi:hypothetical protein